MQVIQTAESAAEPWQDVSRQQWFNLEQQKGAGEDRDGIDEHRRA
jgi:hypothetical protein